MAVQQASRAFGFVSLGLSALAILGLARARIGALISAMAHAVRGRFAGIFAWLPAVTSLPLVGWLVAYIFFDAFRNS